MGLPILSGNEKRGPTNLGRRYNHAVMLARDFYKAVTVDNAELMHEVMRQLEAAQSAYCVIDGQGVNAYVEPLVSLDLDLVVAAADVDRVLSALPPHVRVERFEHSINLSAPGSDLRVQIQTDPRYADFPARAGLRLVLGVPMRVASAEDVLAGKVWAVSDATRRASKRLKDLADIARLIEQFPDLRSGIPSSLLDKLL